MAEYTVHFRNQAHGPLSSQNQDSQSQILLAALESWNQRVGRLRKIIEPFQLVALVVIMYRPRVFMTQEK